MKPGFVIAAAVLMTLALGSIHAFSVFLEVLEIRFEASRGTVSFSYSLGLASLTVAVLVGPKIFGRVNAAMLSAMACLMAAGGVAIAAAAPNIAIFWIAYGLVFGFGNGIGYGFALQIAAQAMPGREGFAMGLVTAGYGLGAALAPAGFEAGLAAGGSGLALGALAGVLVVIALVAAALMSAGRARYSVTQEQGPGSIKVPPLLWVAYAAGVFAGLMALGHATGILQGNGVAALWLAPTVVALANTSASLAAGWLTDRLAWRSLLIAIPAVGTVALLLLATMPGWIVALAAIAVVGACYGAAITIWPAVIAKTFGPAGPAIYGRVFTGWGVAGLIGPWVAGALFDATGGYSIALIAAAALSIVAVIATARLHLPAP